MASRFETVLSDDVLNYCVLSMLHYRDAVALSAANSHLRTRTRMRIKEIKASLPPPFSPETLDKALAANDIVNSTRLLRIAVSRLRRNLETISSRLLERGYPVATNCALCGRRYLAPMEDIDERVAALRATGVEVPLILVELWRHLGGFALAVCTHPSLLYPSLFHSHPLSPTSACAEPNGPSRQRLVECRHARGRRPLCPRRRAPPRHA